MEALGSSVAAGSPGATLDRSADVSTRAAGTSGSPTSAPHAATATNGHAAAGGSQAPAAGTSTLTKRTGWSTITGPQRRNPYESLEFPPAHIKGFSLQKTFKVGRAVERGW